MTRMDLVSGIKVACALLMALVVITPLQAKEHPCLLHTKQVVGQMRAQAGSLPIFKESVQEVQARANQYLLEPIVVPIPKDPGGGYTHEKHKANYSQMWDAGVCYQLTGDERYARYVVDMLMAYAKLYPTLGYHPDQKSKTPGRLFWQALNDCVWLVHTSVAYDCVYEYMQPKDREYVEKQLFVPMAQFISNGNPDNLAVFNKMHNHGTWATASVGMIGYVMDNKDLTDKALYGFDKKGKGGFMLQLNELFSPDGYYTEGVYYLRYAIWPFMLFAQAIEHNQPEVKVFDANNQILIKAANAIFQMMYADQILYINDALEKNIYTQELIYAIDIAYAAKPAESRQLLDIARRQQRVIVTDAGYKTALAIADGQALPFVSKPILLRDGGKGTQGAFSILRFGQGVDQTCVALKATSHGLSHGHYDKLSISFYDNGAIILPDYGAVRFVNIAPKYGGHYTKENNSYGLQSIAHNTLVVDETSHFDGVYNESSKYWSEQMYFDVQDSIQVSIARDQNAYKGQVTMQRTVVLVKDAGIPNPIVVDVMRAQSDKPHTYDLPYYYRGHMVSTSFPYQKSMDVLRPLGTRSGYQHLWVEAQGQPVSSGNACFTWILGNRFYSITSVVDKQTEYYLLRLGANDKDFNFRPETAYMLRQKEATNHTFVSVIEPHGNYDINIETVDGYQSQWANVQVLHDDAQYVAVRLQSTEGAEYLLLLCQQDFTTKEHSLTLQGKTYQWKGVYRWMRVK